ncbi:MAG: hypothetical protein ABIQ09_16055 [Jatrophihabitantaceae bacterium]
MKRRPGIHVTQQYNVSAGGSTGAWMGQANVFLKVSTDRNQFAVGNEFIGARLAVSLGISSPPGDIVELSGGKLAYACLGVANTGETPAPLDILEVGRRNLAFAARVLVFDEWIMNPDRHDENVIWWPGAIPYVIDHEKALFGPRGNLPTDPSLPERIVTKRHPFRSVLNRRQIVESCRRLQILPIGMIRLPVEQASSLGLITDEQARNLITTLVQRQARISTLVLSATAGTVTGAAKQEPDLFDLEEE